MKTNEDMTVSRAPKPSHGAVLLSAEIAHEKIASGENIDADGWMRIADKMSQHCDQLRRSLVETRQIYRLYGHQQKVMAGKLAQIHALTGDIDSAEEGEIK
jgi:hypothetical protein